LVLALTSASASAVQSWQALLVPAVERAEVRVGLRAEVPVPVQGRPLTQWEPGLMWMGLRVRAMRRAQRLARPAWGSQAVALANPTHQHPEIALCPARVGDVAVSFRDGHSAQSNPALALAAVRGRAP
jgi:hypothetical protein